MVNKTMYLITGRCGAGKTTFVKHCGLNGCPTFHSGAVYRDVFNNDYAKEDDPEAPAKADVIIKNRFFNWLDSDLCKQSLKPLIAESIPRNKNSVGWIQELIERGYDIRVIFLTASRKVRESRILSRGISSDRLNEDVKRLNNESDDKWTNLLVLLRNINVMPNVIDTTEFFPSNLIGKFSENSTITTMFTNAINVYNEKTAYKYTSKEINFNRMVSRAIEELEEAKQVDDDTWHKSTELIDALHFIFVAFYSLDLFSCNIVNRFLSKTSANQARLHIGDKICQ